MTLKRANARRTILLGEVIKGSGSRRRRRKIRLGPYGAFLVTALIAYAVVDAAALTYAQVTHTGGTLRAKGMPLDPQQVENVAIILTRPNKGTDEALDAVMALHLPGSGRRPVAVLMPPQLRVRLPNGKTGRLVDAYEDGIDPTLEVIEGFTRWRFDAAAVVRLDAVSRLADSVGGIEMKATGRFRSGVADVGDTCTELTPEAIDDIVMGGPEGSRMARMRNLSALSSAIASRVSSIAAWLDPVRVVREAKAVRSAVRSTTKGSLQNHRHLASIIEGVGPATVDLRSVPISEPAARIQGVTYVIANDRQTRSLFQAMSDGQPLPPVGRSETIAIEPSDVQLTILNGTTTEGLAKKVAADLATRGFTEAPTANAPAHESTTVYFRQGNEQKAKLVASRFGVEVREVTADIPSSSDVTMVLGQDFVGGSVKLLAQPEVNTDPQAADRALLVPCE